MNLKTIYRIYSLVTLNQSVVLMIVTIDLLRYTVTKIMIVYYYLKFWSSTTATMKELIVIDVAESF